MTLTMQDSSGDNFTPGFDVYAGYLDRVAGGHTASYVWAYEMARAQNARDLSITTDADFGADIFDVEAGAESMATASRFFAGQTTTRPIFYVAGSNVDTLVATLADEGIARAKYRILSAHYGQGEHICGPHTCGACSTTCDGTQWMTTPTNGYDASILLASFFDAPEPQETTMALAVTAPPTDTQLHVYRENADGTVQHWWQNTSGPNAGKWEGPETLPGAAA